MILLAVDIDNLMLVVLAIVVKIVAIILVINTLNDYNMVVYSLKFSNRTANLPNYLLFLS